MRRIPLLLLLAGGTAVAAAPPRGPRIEVAFVLDVTGSMQPWIDAARGRIAGIARDLASGDPRPEVRFALVEFRDKGDAFVTRVHPFTPALATMQGELDAAKADGGGDTPEAVLEGIAAGITQLDWSASDDRVMKLLYVVGDAEPHHYKDSPTDAWIVAEALKRGIVIHTIACSGMSAAGLSEFELVARETEGRTVHLAERVARTGLGATVSASARAYSAAAGVSYGKGPLAPIAAMPLALPAGAAGAASAPSGLLGAEMRVIADERAWSDLLAAHGSLGLAVPRLPVDFARSRVLALGGADAGLELVRLERGDGVAFATLRPASAGVRFIVVPADAGTLVAREVAP